jgi:hypothetical protein
MFKGTKNVANPTYSKNKLVNKVHDMHHTSTKNTFCGISHGEINTTVDKTAVAATGSVVAITAVLGGISFKVPTAVRVVWALIRSKKAPQGAVAP